MTAAAQGRQVYMIEADVFQQLLKDVSEIKETLRHYKPNHDQEPISHKEAAAFLMITRDTLTRRIKCGTYPATIVHINGSRKVYFKSELKALLNPK